MLSSSEHLASTREVPWFLRAVWRLSDIAGVIAAAMIVIAVGITCQMIFVRKVLNESTIWQTEAVIYLMVGATLIGLSYVQRVRGHVNVDLLPRWLGAASRRLLSIVTSLVVIALLGMILFYGTELWYVAWDRGWASDTVWGPPIWIPYLALPVGFGLFFLQTIADLVAVLLRVEQPFGMTEKS